MTRKRGGRTAASELIKGGKYPGVAGAGYTCRQRNEGKELGEKRGGRDELAGGRRVRAQKHEPST